MSSQNGGSGGGFFLLLAGALLVAVLTNPSEQAHRAAISSRTPVVNLGLGMMEITGASKLSYHNCMVFSYTTLDSGNRTGIPLTTGFLGKVYYGKEKQ
jgi:hypothetical protein